VGAPNEADSSSAFQPDGSCLEMTEQALMVSKTILSSMLPEGIPK
jgi:hypothetical protein